MKEEQLLHQIQHLPASVQQQIFAYITRIVQAHRSAKKVDKFRVFGSSKGKYQLSDDFDEPLQDFEAYMS